MGVYYFFACVDQRDRIVASFNPQHGFGGLKWGEFVGTSRGDRMFALLEDRYCPDGCRWRVVDDADDDVGIDRVRDFAWNLEVRADALAKGITTSETLNMMDDIADRLRVAFGDGPNFHGAACADLRIRNRTIRRLATQ